jgi:hypothetical protein
MSDLETFILRTWVVLQPLIIRALWTLAAGLCVWVLGFYLLLNPFKEPFWPMMRHSLRAFGSVVLFFGSKIKNLIVWGLLGLSLTAFLANFLMLLRDVTNVMLMLRTLTAGLCLWLLSFYIFLKPFKEPFWPVMHQAVRSYGSILHSFGSMLGGGSIWGLLGISLVAFFWTFLVLLGDTARLVLGA